MAEKFNKIHPKARRIAIKGHVNRDKSYCIDASYHKGTNFTHYVLKSIRQIVFNKPVKITYIGKDTQSNRVYDINGKSVTLSANGGGWGAKTGLYFIHQDTDHLVIRKLTPRECERLQGLPNNYTEGVSNTQRYRMIGNGFTIPVIAHILSFSPEFLFFPHNFFRPYTFLNN